MSTNLMEASRQWSNRPADERFWGLDDLGRTLKDSRSRSAEKETPTNQLRAVSLPDGQHGTDLAILVPGGHTKLTHWSFNQICIYAGAPAGYLRQLPPKLAAENLNHGLRLRSEDRTNLLLHRNTENREFTLRSMTTEKYSRLWNNDLIEAMKPNLSRGWMIPPARPSGHYDERARKATINDIVPNQEDFGLAVKVGDMIAPAGVYASDRDMFVFMVNPDRVIDDGMKELMRGIIIKNSEVGAGAFSVQSFYFENVCSNHIIWGVSGVQKLRVVHKGSAIRGIAEKMRKQLESYSHQDTSADRGMIRAARNNVIARTKAEVVKVIYNNKSIGLSQTDIEGAYNMAEKWEHTALSAPVTTWGFVHGLTRYSQLMHHMDARAKLDAAGGKLLQLTAEKAGIDTKQLALPAPR